MNDKWSDFEKYVFRELSTISKKLSKLEGRAATWGAVAGLIAATLGDVLVKHLLK